MTCIEYKINVCICENMNGTLIVQIFMHIWLKSDDIQLLYMYKKREYKLQLQVPSYI